MVSLKNKAKGFTIIELLIVLIVIGILATLVIITFTGIQQKTHNTQREQDITDLDSHIEGYYAKTGNYPTYAQLTSANWRATNMKSLNAKALVDPRGKSLTNKAAPSGTYAYSYVATEGDVTPCTSPNLTTDDAKCDTFTLSTNLEGSSTPYIKKSN